MTSTDYIVEVLGGRKLLKTGRKISPGQLHERIRAGLPYKSLQALLTKLRLSRRDAVAVLHLPGRTLARRKHSQKLPADESDRLFRLARIGAQAVQVLGSEAKAATWLQRPNRALNGDPPLKLLETDIGARQVEQLLGRIEHGIVS